VNKPLIGLIEKQKDFVLAAGSKSEHHENQMTFSGAAYD